MREGAHGFQSMLGISTEAAWKMVHIFVLIFIFIALVMSIFIGI